MHSGDEKKGTEAIGKKNRKIEIAGDELDEAKFAPTYQVVILFANILYTTYLGLGKQFCLFLDNLFLNVDVARALQKLGIACAGTARKNARGLPDELIELKKQNRALLWDSTVAKVVCGVLCFLWQDNNAVLGMSTAHSLHRPSDKVYRLRKRR
jgi:hypothetical protein